MKSVFTKKEKIFFANDLTNEMLDFKSYLPDKPVFLFMTENPRFIHSGFVIFTYQNVKF
jgi:hypothetical protein